MIPKEIWKHDKDLLSKMLSILTKIKKKKIKRVEETLGGDRFAYGIH